jgi:uncharacterized membrane protein
MITNNKIKVPLLFMAGGMIYGAIEIIARDWTHVSMFIVGGICFVLIGLLKYADFSVTEQMLISCAIITVLELVSGIILNVWWGLEVWDYSEQRFNLLGQICLHASSVWVFVSFIGIYADSSLRQGMFREKRVKMRILP